MNEEIKKQWVDALRGGEYQQGKEYLLIDNQYCCLGVLCDLHRKQWGEVEWEPLTYKDVKTNGQGMGYMGATVTLPDTVRSWAELSSYTPTVAHPSFDSKIGLDTLNDSGHTFVEIADLIEAQL